MKTLKRSGITFHHMARVWWTSDFGTNDISFGVHICWEGRIDIHFWKGMLSLGRVPIYENHTHGKFVAVSNSYHNDKSKPSRAGVPDVFNPKR